MAPKKQAKKVTFDPWSQLAPGAKEVLDQATGILFAERYDSFTKNKWPYREDNERDESCNPRSLALAGLGFLSLEPNPTAQCQVCLRIFRDLKADDNPWVLHTTANPECELVRMGQRFLPDHYQMYEVIELAFAKVFNVAKKAVQDKEDKLKRQLCALRQLEIDREAAKAKKLEEMENKTEKPSSSKRKH